MQAPFDEKEKRCLAFMEFTKKWMLLIELTTSPLISIVMPAFNRQDVIGAAIDSVLAQTYTNWELLIVDDASSDETRSVIESYEDARIHNIFLAENGGCSRARNTGLDAARGEIIAYLDSDNEWDPDFLNVMVRAFQVDKTAESALRTVYIRALRPCRWRFVSVPSTGVFWRTAISST
jgi:O-antigen biosynthesis protein